MREDREAVVSPAPGPRVIRAEAQWEVEVRYSAVGAEICSWGQAVIGLPASHVVWMLE